VPGLEFEPPTSGVTWTMEELKFSAMRAGFNFIFIIKRDIIRLQ
jgi:hypothetical protein